MQLSGAYHSGPNGRSLEALDGNSYHGCRISITDLNEIAIGHESFQEMVTNVQEWTVSLLVSLFFYYLSGFQSGYRYSINGFQICMVFTTGNRFSVKRQETLRSNKSKDPSNITTWL